MIVCVCVCVCVCVYAVLFSFCFIEFIYQLKRYSILHVDYDIVSGISSCMTRCQFHCFQELGIFEYLLTSEDWDPDLYQEYYAPKCRLFP